MGNTVIADDQRLNVHQIGGKSASADDLPALRVLYLDDASWDSIRDVRSSNG